MSKFLKTAAMVVGAVALVASGVGLALGPAAAGLAGSAGIAGLSVTSLATITSIAASGLGMLASLTAKKPSANISGSPTSFRADMNAGIPYGMGRSFMSGNIVHRAAYGKDNQYQSFIVVYSGGGPIQQFEKFEVDRVATTFSGDAATGYYSGWLWWKNQLGACPEAIAVNFGGGTIPDWGPAHKLSGYAAACLTMKWDKKGKKFTAGVPQNGVVARWVKVYDPRLDSTYPGGSGSCRALVESTYVWSENPWLHALTFALGRWQNGKRVLGIGMSFEGIDFPAFVDAANVADLNSWKVGGFIYSHDDKWNNLKLIGQAGGGEPIRSYARLSCMVSAPRVSLDTITKNDLAGDIEISATQSRRVRINTIIPRYRSEDHGWEIISANEVKVTEYIALDDGVRSREQEYPLVQQKNQVAQLAAYDIVNAREFPFSLPLKPEFIGYKPGDALTVNIPEAGLSNQLAIIKRRSLDPQTGVVTLYMQSESPTKHAYALGQVGVAPPIPDLTVPVWDNLSAPAITDWSLSAGPITSIAGTMPGVRITGSVTTLNADAIVFEIRQSGDVSWTGVSQEPVETTIKDVLGLAPGDYEVAVSYIVRGVLTPRRILGPVNSGGVSDPVLNAQIDAIQAAAEAAEDAAEDAQIDATNALSAVNNITANNILDKSEKPEIIQQFNTITNERTGISAQATAYGITTENTAYNNAYIALQSYLNGLSPAWNTVTVDTPIDRATFNTRFTDFYVARQVVLNKIAAEAGRRADWALLTNIPYDEIINNSDAAALDLNGSFELWTGTYPGQWSIWGGAAPVKETSIVRVGSYSARWTVSGGDVGMNWGRNWPTAPLPVGVFIAGTIDVQIISYTSGQPTLYVRLYTNAGLTTFVDTTVSVPVPTATGVWQRVPWTARVGAGQRIYGIGLYIMASWSGGSRPFVGSVAFDNVDLAFFDNTTDNKSITLSTTGVLGGGGGGTVTISGLGYQGDMEATRNEDGANMFEDPLRMSTAALGSGPGIREDAGGSAGNGSPRDNYRLRVDGNNAWWYIQAKAIPVVAGELLYASAVFWQGNGATGLVVMGFHYFDGAMTYKGGAAAIPAADITDGTWVFREAEFLVPAGTSYIMPYFQRHDGNSSGNCYLAEPFLARTRKGATRGAPPGTPIGSTNSSDIESSVNNGLDTAGNVKPGKVTTPSITSNAVTTINTFFYDFGGTHPVSAFTWYYISNGVSVTAGVTVTSGPDAAQAIRIDMMCIFDGDGGDRDNISVRMLRSDGAVLSQSFGVLQLDTFIAPYSFIFIDPSPAINTTYVYYPQLYSSGDGNPFIYDVILTGLVLKK